jgi:hypothetical protein
MEWTGLLIYVISVSGNSDLYIIYDHNEVIFDRMISYLSLWSLDCGVNHVCILQVQVRTYMYMHIWYTELCIYCCPNAVMTGIIPHQSAQTIPYDLVANNFNQTPTHFAFLMHLVHNSETSHNELEDNCSTSMDTHTGIFKVTPEDANILKEYIVEFQEADTETWNKILEKSMGELYKLHPRNSPFDKKDIKQACDSSIHIWSDSLIHMCIRDWGSGFIITIILHTIRVLGSFVNGPPEMSSTMPRRIISWNMLKIYLEVLQDLRHF